MSKILLFKPFNDVPVEVITRAGMTNVKLRPLAPPVVVDVPAVRSSMEETQPWQLPEPPPRRALKEPVKVDRWDAICGHLAGWCGGMAFLWGSAEYFGPQPNMTFVGLMFVVMSAAIFTTLGLYIKGVK
jgi:hypothetical protein